MRYLSLIVLAYASVAGAYEPAPARITTADRVIETLVIEETLDGVQFLLGDDARAKTALSRKLYKTIEYTRSRDANFDTAEAYYEKKGDDLAKAVELYRKAISSASFQWVVEKSYVRAVECLLDPAVNKPDEGLELIDTFFKNFPQSVHLPAATALRADLRLAKGDLVGAEDDYSTFEKNAASWNVSRIRGILGRAEILRRNKKYPEAAALLQGAFATIRADLDPEGWAKLGLALADVQNLAGQKDPVTKTLRLVALSNASATLRGKAHLNLAKRFADGASGQILATAFDHAVLATVHAAEDPVTHQEARALAKRLLVLMEKDNAFSPEDRKEYREYARTL